MLAWAEVLPRPHRSWPDAQGSWSPKNSNKGRTREERFQDSNGGTETANTTTANATAASVSTPASFAITIPFRDWCCYCDCCCFCGLVQTVSSSILPSFLYGKKSQEALMLVARRDSSLQLDVCRTPATRISSGAGKTPRSTTRHGTLADHKLQCSSDQHLRSKAGDPLPYKEKQILLERVCCFMWW